MTGRNSNKGFWDPHVQHQRQTSEISFVLNHYVEERRRRSVLL